MRILQVISHYVPAHRFGGPLQVAHSLSKAMVREGHEVYVFCTNLADETNDLDVLLDSPVDVEGVTVYYEPTFISRYWGFSPQLWRRVATEITHADIVIVHAHYQFANWAGAWLARRYQKPYIIFAHGSLHRVSIGHKNGWLKRLYLRFLEHSNFHNALFIAFNAPEEKSLSLYNQYGEVVPSGIDPAGFANMPPMGYFRERYPQLQGKTCFLFLGRLDIQQKGLDLLIPAFARLVNEDPDAHLVLAGPDEDDGANQIQMLAAQYEIENSITLTGLITGQDKLAALQDADAFLLPSRFEGLSIALLEALYMGLPMLVTDQVGLHKEIDRVGAGLVVQAKLEAIYTGLQQLSELDTRVSMRGRGTELILRKYTWDAIAHNFTTRIQELIS